MATPPRTTETREAQQRTKPWRPAPALPSPPEHPDYDYRWVRRNYGGNIMDLGNLRTRQEEGYEPVTVNDQPELKSSMHLSSQMVNSGNIEWGGQILCRCLKETRRGREEYYSRLGQEQLDAVENKPLAIANQTRGMPVSTEHRGGQSKSNPFE